eukprot:CAMPEP_0168525764 /NCGR_PEP_ID=MMETSP0405-20121227/11513_1 /TAXON_ID=498012 /ORGANISM="Trichosphaerium sp, Strain Am-I-7 wt" /LENGTH=54 /DNA_ID=CAMNT_0008548371 /DNA_START=317 /DNA_END=481 /DNA_ORIENTATION=+
MPTRPCSWARLQASTKLSQLDAIPQPDTAVALQANNDNGGVCGGKVIVEGSASK